MWNVTTRVGFLVLWLVAPSFAWAQPPPPTRNRTQPKTTQLSEFGRVQAIAYAYKHNPKLLAFRARLRKALARFKGSQVYPNNPTLSASGGVQLPETGPGSLLPRVSANLSLALPVGGRWGKKQQWAKAQFERVKTEWTLRKFQLALQIHRAWNKMVVAQQQHKLRIVISAFLQRLAKLTRARIKQGVGNQLELQLALASELRATQARLDAGALYRQRKQQVGALLGHPNVAALRFQHGALPAPVKAPSLSSLLRKSMPRHPRLQLARAVLKQSQNGLRWQQAKAIPDLTVSLGYSLEDGAHVVTGGLSIPLPLFWRNQGGIGQQRARIQQAQRLLISQRYQLRQKMKQALTHYQNDLVVLRIFRQRLQSAKAQFNLIEKGLKLGVFTPFQTLTAQRSIVGSQLQQLQLVSHALTHYLEVCEAAGVLPAWGRRQQP